MPLCLSELEAKIVRESLPVAGDLLIEPLDRHPVKAGKVGVKDNGLAAEADDGLPGFRSGLSLDGTHRATILHRYNNSIANCNSILGEGEREKRNSPLKASQCIAEFIIMLSCINIACIIDVLRCNIQSNEYQ